MLRSHAILAVLMHNILNILKSEFQTVKVSERSQQAARRHVFILRRATWSGLCKVADVVRAFDVTPQAASLDLNRAVEIWMLDGRPLLTRGRGCVRQIFGLPEHPQASPLVMLELLRRSAPFQETGLREYECLTLHQPLQGVQTSTQESLSAILRSLVRLGAEAGRPIQRTLEIDYVGLKVGDTIRTRWVAPVGLEFDGAQVRLWAHDLLRQGYPLKSFVLSRIMAARVVHRQMPSGVRPELALPQETVTLQAAFDEQLTTDQRQAIARELGLDDHARLKAARHRVFQLQHLYAKAAHTQEAIWPPLLSLQEVRSS